MASVRKNKRDGGWLCAWSDASGPHTKQFQTRRDALEHQRAVQVPAVLRDGTETFAQSAAAWLQIMNAASLADTTLQELQRVVRKHLLPTFGQRRTCTISAGDLRGFSASIRLGLAGSYGDYIASVLRRILAAAETRGVVHTAPVTFSTRSKAALADPIAYRYLREHRTPHSVSEADLPTLDIVRRLLLESEGLPRLLFHLCVFVGPRAGELRALTKRDVDLVHHRLQIRSSLPRKLSGKIEEKEFLEISSNGEHPTKSEAGSRWIPLDPKLEEVLKVRLQEMANDPDSAPLIPGRNGHCSVGELKGLMRRAQFGMGVSRLTKKGKRGFYYVHLLRHLCVSLWLRAGYSIDQIVVWVGHADIKTTLETYAHYIGS